MIYLEDQVQQLQEKIKTAPSISSFESGQERKSSHRSVFISSFYVSTKKDLGKILFSLQNQLNDGDLIYETKGTRKKFFFEKGKFSLPKSEDPLKSPENNSLYLYTYIPEVNKNKSKNANLNDPVLKRPCHPTPLKISAHYNSGVPFAIKGFINKIEFWIIPSELKGEAAIVNVIAYTELGVGYNAEHLLMWNSILHRWDEEVINGRIIAKGLKDYDVASRYLKNVNIEIEGMQSVSLKGYKKSVLNKLRIGRYLKEGQFMNFPFCFVCLDKPSQSEEINKEGNFVKESTKFDGTTETTYLRSNETIRKYFNHFRMFRTISIGADTIEPLKYVGNKDTEYQQWGSTRYCFSTMGGIILSLSTDDEGIELPVNKINMVDWFEEMYVPILMLNLYYRMFLMFFSDDLESQVDINQDSELLIENHQIFLEFMKNHWFYHISRNVQSEGIWESWKEALNVNVLFENIRSEVNELVSMNELQQASILNKNLFILTTVAILLASISAFNDSGLIKLLNDVHAFYTFVIAISFGLLVLWIIRRVTSIKKIPILKGIKSKTKPK